MSDAGPRLYIPTRDLRDGGGVASMARFVYETATDAGYDPCLVANSLDRSERLSLADRFGWDPRDAVDHTAVDGYEAKFVPLVLPQIEFTQYLLNEDAWRAALSDGDLFFAVGGTNHCTLPLVRAGVPFGSWIATLLWEDRIDRLQRAPLLEQVRDRLSRPILELIERRGYRAADPSFVLSDHTADEAVRKYGLDTERIEVIPYPVDTEQFTPDGEPVDTQADGPVVLFVGRLNDPRKNTPLLIDAFDRISDTAPGAELWLIGAEPDEALSRAIERSGIADRIVCPGPVPHDELPAYYRAADVFVIPSNQEGLAIVGLEAMASGVPVVSTTCGGPEQYVVDDDTGYTVPVDDTDALAARLEQVLADPAHRAQLGANARDLMTREYAEEVVAERFVSAFETLRDRTPAKPLG